MQLAFILILSDEYIRHAIKSDEILLSVKAEKEANHEKEIL